MGNSICTKNKTAKVMKLDGVVIRPKPLAAAGDVLRDHPGGYSLLDANEVKRLGVYAQPLDPARPLEAGKLYFLVELPRLPYRPGIRRVRSGAVHASAMDRLESLRLSQRRRLSAADVWLSVPQAVDAAAGEGAVQIRLRLRKAYVTKLMKDSADSSEAVERIVELCFAEEAAKPASPVAAGEERRTRFTSVVDEKPVEAIDFN